MTGPIIPADQWPEWADRHCWDKNGNGWFYGMSVIGASAWFPESRRSRTPMPDGHDWRVPLMRPSAEEVRAQDNMDAGWYSRREAHAHAMGYTGVAEAMDDLESRRSAPAIDPEQFREAVEAFRWEQCLRASGAKAAGNPLRKEKAQRKIAHADRLMALIDGQAGKGEGEAGGD